MVWYVITFGNTLFSLVVTGIIFARRNVDDILRFSFNYLNLYLHFTRIMHRQYWEYYYSLFPWIIKSNEIIRSTSNRIYSISVNRAPQLWHEGVELIQKFERVWYERRENEIYQLYQSMALQIVAWIWTKERQTFYCKNI